MKPARPSPPTLLRISALAWLCAAVFLLPSCLYQRRVVFEHDTLTGRDTMTYRGKAISPEELYELGEKTGFGKIDLILKNDGTTQKLDFKTWHTGMRLIPAAMQGDALE